MNRTESEAKDSALTSVLFYLGFAGFIGHELDAVLHAEWELLYILRSLPDPTASSVFVLLHVPLVLTILWLGNHSRPRIRIAFRFTFSVFLIVHGSLHFALSDAPANSFDGFVSHLLIYSTSAVGLAYAILQCRRSKRWGEFENLRKR